MNKLKEHALDLLMLYLSIVCALFILFILCYVMVYLPIMIILPNYGLGPCLGYISLVFPIVIYGINEII